MSFLNGAFSTESQDNSVHLQNQIYLQSHQTLKYSDCMQEPDQGMDLPEDMELDDKEGAEGEADNDVNDEAAEKDATKDASDFPEDKRQAEEGEDPTQPEV